MKHLCQNCPLLINRKDAILHLDKARAHNSAKQIQEKNKMGDSSTLSKLTRFSIYRFLMVLISRIFRDKKKKFFRIILRKKKQDFLKCEIVNLPSC